MLIPIVGELMTAIGLIFCTYFDYWPMEVAGVTEALFPGLAGEKNYPSLYAAQFHFHS
jgi:MFS transporter, PCFT/HCP family, solute carrier family 46, member 3